MSELPSGELPSDESLADQLLSAQVPTDQPSMSLFIPIHNGQLLCGADGVWRPLTQNALSATGMMVHSKHFIESQADTDYWAIEIQDHERDEEVYQWLGLRSQLGLIDEAQFLLVGRAMQVVQWYLDHRFCGRCGAPTLDAESERAKLCPTCDLHFYPRISPCVIVLITRGDECLLARHARSKNSLYTALAGFVEAGERLEDTIHREIFEEVGLRVKHPVYFKSQPWPFPNQLMLGFHVEYSEGDISVDGEEILDAQWYRFDQLPQVPPPATLSGQLIQHFVENLKQ